MGSTLGRIVVVIVLLLAAALGAAFYMGILDWRSTSTQIRVQGSNVAAEVRQAVDGVSGPGGGKNAAEGAPGCRANLLRIHQAKKAAAAKSASEVGEIGWDPVLKELGGTKPVCPSGGVYTLGDLQSNPRCSIGTSSTLDKADDHFLANY